jgi:PleD family two-component response regulator
MGGEECLLILSKAEYGEAIRIVDRIRDGFPSARWGRIDLPCTYSAGIPESLPGTTRVRSCVGPTVPCLLPIARNGTAPGW